MSGFEVDMRVECVCGKTFESDRGLASHEGRYRCRALISSAVLPSEGAAAARHANDSKTHAEAAKKVRTETESEARRSRVCHKLARMRYVKLVPGTTVDDFKQLHIDENQAAYNRVVKELTKQLSTRVPPDELSRAFETVQDAYNIYDGLLTEKQENATLHKLNLPILKYTPRKLPRTKGMAYDFALDEQVTTLLDHCPAARAQMFATITEWATKHPTGTSERRIVCDITDGSVFLNHPILGDQLRVTAEEAEACSEALPLNIAIMVYWDGFTVSFIRLCPQRELCVALRARNARVPYATRAYRTPRTVRVRRTVITRAFATLATRVLHSLLTA